MRAVRLNIMYILLFIIFLYFFPVSVFSQGISFSAKLDSSKILIGDQVKLTLTVKHSGKVKVFFPDLKETVADKIDIVENLGVDTVKTDGGYLVLHQKYLITCFDSGFYLIPPLKVMYQENNKNDSAFSKELLLQVFSVPIDTTKQAICDIKSQMETPFTFKEFFQRFYPVFIIVFILAVLGLLGWYIYKKLKRKEPILKRFIKPKEPPHITALRELDRIKSEKLWQKNMVKEYHSQLTEVIRVYIEGRFEIRAMEQTTEEILQSFRNSGLLDQKCFEILSQMLTLADFVKFAKAEPLPDENDMSLKNAFYFVDNTLVRFIKENEEKPAADTQDKKVILSDKA